METIELKHTVAEMKNVMGSFSIRVEVTEDTQRMRAEQNSPSLTKRK